MGLTVAAVTALVEFAQTKQRLRLQQDCDSAVQLYIAADALDVEDAREEVETYLGCNMLRHDTFLSFWRLSQTFYMQTLKLHLDSFCVDNFGWFYSSLGQGAVHYLSQWSDIKLATMLLEQRFRNCSEAMIFDAVMCYCKAKSEAGVSMEDLIPGLYKSCGAYLKYLQSVPRTLPLKSLR